MQKILILGAGVWGTAIGAVLSLSNHNVDLWHYKEEDLEKVRNRVDSSLSIEQRENISIFSGDFNPNNYDYIFIALPTQSIKEIIESNNFKNSNIVLLSKGIDYSSMLRISEICYKEGASNVSTLYGPTHSQDIIKSSPSSFVCSSPNLSFCNEVKELFKNIDFIKVLVDDDILSSEYFSAFKNSYAIAYGIVDALSDSVNTRSAFFSFICEEFIKVLDATGANREKFYMPHGVGDLLVTCLKGRNRTFGNYIGRGYSLDEAKKAIGMVVEGVNTNRVLKKLSDEKNIELEINSLVYSIINRERSFKEILSLFRT